MAVTFTSAGYGGTVTQANWAKLAAALGCAYSVKGTGSWAVATAAGDRTVTVAPGSGYGYGVMDTTTVAETITIPAVSTGTVRYDLIVARRNWATKLTTFVVVTGGTTRAIPTRNINPGTLDDQPIALVRVASGSTVIGEVVDLRTWGTNGGMMARDDLTLSLLKEPGTSCMVNGTLWNCEQDSSGNAIWTTFTAGRIPLLGAGSPLAGPSTPAGLQFQMQAGSLVAVTDGAGYGRVTFPKAFPNGLLSVVAFNGDDWAIGSGGVTFAGSGNPAHGGSATGSKSDWVYVMYGYGSNNDGPAIRLTNRQHRLNWVAVGW